jgi:hypothetical protein
MLTKLNWNTADFCCGFPLPGLQAEAKEAAPLKRFLLPKFFEHLTGVSRDAHDVSQEVVLNPTELGRLRSI